MDKVLVVDDDEGVATMSGMILQHAGFETFTEVSSSGAYETIISKEIPVVVSDLVMPVMDGLTLFKKVKEKNPDTVFIFITANASIESVVNVMKEGAFSYIKKPFEPNELIQTVKDAFEKACLNIESNNVIKELKSAKNYAEMVLKNLAIATITTDLEGKIEKISRTAEKVLDYTESELLNQSISTILPEHFMSTVWQDIFRKKEVQNYPVNIKNKKGSLISKIFSGKMMKDDHGNEVGILTIFNSNGK